MIESFLDGPLSKTRSLQQQIKERLVGAILGGGLVPHEPLPSTRILADRLSVSRNTVILVYEQLVEDGYLVSLKRRGHFINEEHLRQGPQPRVHRTAEDEPTTARHLQRLAYRPTLQRNIVKPVDWRTYPYPFVYGQVPPDPLSISRWRECVRQAASSRHSAAWTGDLIDADDPMLVRQIIGRILPKRGIRATPEQVLVTVGSQNALYLVASLFAGPSAVVGIEEPGYVDARNILAATGAALRPLVVDGGGVRITGALEGCTLVYVTPSHQSPTSVTLGLPRRLALLEAARGSDALIVEDDYEHELNYIGASRPALRSLEGGRRVLHLGSLSKPLFPGLRIGFVVAEAAIVAELRALRRLMYRHPSALDQRAMGIFLAEGHFDSHVQRQRRQLSRHWRAVMEAVERLLPQCLVSATTGGSAVWLRLPDGLPAGAVQREAASRGVLVEPGDVHFSSDPPPQACLRLGFATIAEERIAPGIALLAEAIEAVRLSRGGLPSQ